MALGMVIVAVWRAGAAGLRPALGPGHSAPGGDANGAPGAQDAPRARHLTRIDPSRRDRALHAATERRIVEAACRGRRLAPPP
jgi:hypothetical protein